MSDDQRRPERRQDGPPPTLRQTVSSVLAAFFGVQSRANRERDFSRGRPIHFIIVGLVATVAFVLGLVLVVRLILATAA